MGNPARRMEQNGRKPPISQGEYYQYVYKVYYDIFILFISFYFRKLSMILTVNMIGPKKFKAI
jgi:hypothetical protein